MNTHRSEIGEISGDTRRITEEKRMNRRIVLVMTVGILVFAGAVIAEPLSPLAAETSGAQTGVETASANMGG